ncbi:MAG TPA: CbtB domain-containing protein [Candidatus Nitrosopolaris sp.]
MSVISKQITKQVGNVPKIAVGILVGILLFGMFLVGYDQGHLFSLAQGQKAFDTKWIHEFSHDLRHAAGFPCH